MGGRFVSEKLDMLRKVVLCVALTALFAGAFANDRDDYEDVLNFLAEDNGNGDGNSDGKPDGTPQPIPACDDECAKKADPDNKSDETELLDEDTQAPVERHELDNIMHMPTDEDYSAGSVEELENLDEADNKHSEMSALHAEELAKSKHLNSADSNTLMQLAEKIKKGSVDTSEIKPITALLDSLEKKIIAARAASLDGIEEMEKEHAELTGELKELTKELHEAKSNVHKNMHKCNKELDLIYFIRKALASINGKACKMSDGKDCHSKATWSSYNHCYAAAGSHFDHRSASWKTMPGMSCKIKTNGGKIRVTFDFSVYGNPHGGVRLHIVNKAGQGVIKGAQSHYGFDWVLPRNTNYWYKRSLVRVFSLAAGEYTFNGQFRSQANGYRTFIHGGTPSQQYSSAWMIIEEIPEHANFFYVHRQSAYNTNNGQWATIQTIPNVKTAGGCLKYQFDASIYGIHHGGMRLLIGGKVFGQQGTYGMDWMLAEGTNWWQKRNLVRFFCGIPHGSHTAHVQVRSQASGRQLYIHGGSTAQMYSGSWYLLQEVQKSVGFNFVQCASGIDQRSTAWTHVPNCALEFSSSGKDTLFMVDFSVYGNHHGGMRIINRANNAVVVGHQPTYGMDWVIPHYNNIWQKRCMYRVLPKGKLSAGTYSLGLQVRSQATNYRCYFHGGSIGHQYSGIWFAARELH